MVVADSCESTTVILCARYDIARFCSDCMQALQHVYPNYKWLFWRFTGSTHLGFWQKQENRQEFFDWLGTQLGLKKMDDWYNVTREDIYKRGGYTLLHNLYSGCPSKALQAVYPEHNWRFDNPLKMIETSSPITISVSNLVTAELISTT